MENDKDIDKSELREFEITFFAEQKGKLIVKAKSKKEAVDRYMNDELDMSEIEIIDGGEWFIERIEEMNG